MLSFSDSISAVCVFPLLCAFGQIVSRDDDDSCELSLPVAIALRSLRQSQVAAHLMQTLRHMSSSVSSASSTASASSTPKAAAKSTSASSSSSAEEKSSSSSYVRVAHVWAALMLLPTMSIAVDELAPLLAATFERLDHIVNSASSSASSSSSSTASSSSSSSSSFSAAASVRRVFRAPRLDAHALLAFDAAVALRAECARALMRTLTSNQHGALSSATIGAAAAASAAAGGAAGGGQLHLRMLNAPFFARFVWPLMQASSSASASAAGTVAVAEAEEALQSAAAGATYTSQATANSHPIALRAVLYYFQIAYAFLRDTFPRCLSIDCHFVACLDCSQLFSDLNIVLVSHV